MIAAIALACAAAMVPVERQRPSRIPLFNQAGNEEEILSALGSAQQFSRPKSAASPYALNAPDLPDTSHDYLLPFALDPSISGVPFKTQAPAKAIKPMSYPRTEKLFPSAGRLKYAYGEDMVTERRGDLLGGDVGLWQSRSQFDPVNQNDPLRRMEEHGEDVRQVRFDDRARQTQATSYAFTTDKMNDVSLPSVATQSLQLGGGLRHSGNARFMPTMDRVGPQHRGDHPGAPHTEAVASEARWAAFRRNPHDLSADDPGVLGGAFRPDTVPSIQSVYNEHLPTQREQFPEEDFVNAPHLARGNIVGERGEFAPPEYLAREDISVMHAGAAHDVTGQPYADPLYHRNTPAQEARLVAAQRSRNSDFVGGAYTQNATGASLKPHAGFAREELRSQHTIPNATKGFNNRVSAEYSMRDPTNISYTGISTAPVQVPLGNKSQVQAIKRQQLNNYLTPAVFRTLMRADK